MGRDRNLTYRMPSTLLGLMAALTVVLSACRLPSQTSTPPATTTPELSTSIDSDAPVDSDPGAGPEVTPSPTDYVVIPGERVGPITAETRRADLVALYGTEALDDRPIDIGEGFTEPGTVINAGSDHQVAIVWAEATSDGQPLPTSDQRPLMAKDFGAAWQTPEGLGVGTTHQALQRILGRFQLYGFAWDYGGTVVLEGTQLSQYDGYLWLRLAPSETAIAQHSDLYQAVMGDSLFASDDSNVSTLNPSVYEIVVYFENDL